MADSQPARVLPYERDLNRAATNPRNLNSHVHIAEDGVFVDGVHLPLWVQDQPIELNQTPGGVASITLTLLTAGGVTVSDELVQETDEDGNVTISHPPKPAGDAA